MSPLAPISFHKQGVMYIPPDHQNEKDKSLQILNTCYFFDCSESRKFKDIKYDSQTRACISQKEFTLRVDLFTFSKVRIHPSIHFPHFFHVPTSLSMEWPLCTVQYWHLGSGCCEYGKLRKSSQRFQHNYLPRSFQSRWLEQQNTNRECYQSSAPFFRSYHM